MLIQTGCEQEGEAGHVDVCAVPRQTVSVMARYIPAAQLPAGRYRNHRTTQRSQTFKKDTGLTG